MLVFLNRLERFYKKKKNTTTQKKHQPKKTPQNPSKKPKTNHNTKMVEKTVLSHAITSPISLVSFSSRGEFKLWLSIQYTLIATECYRIYNWYIWLSLSLSYPVFKVCGTLKHLRNKAVTSVISFDTGFPLLVVPRCSSALLFPLGHLTCFHPAQLKAQLLKYRKLWKKPWKQFRSNLPAIKFLLVIESFKTSPLSGYV